LQAEPIYSEHNKAPINYAVCNDRVSLLYLANLGCIDQNPWMSRIGSLDSPDFILIDLDPQECPYDRIVEAALLVHEKLEQIGLTGYPKTTGGDGMHIYIPLENSYTYEQARVFAEILGVMLSGKRPDLFTTPRSVAKRDKGKVYFDYLQIGEGKTISAPLRPARLRRRPGFNAAGMERSEDWTLAQAIPYRQRGREVRQGRRFVRRCAQEAAADREAAGEAGAIVTLSEMTMVI